MNKKFAAFFSGYGMTVEGNSAYGTFNGYETNALLSKLDNRAPVKIHISFYATDEQKRNIECAIRNLALKYFSMEFTQYGIKLGFNDLTLGKLLKRLPAVLEEICRIISENGALKNEFCPVCGNRLDPSNTKKCNISGFSINIDNDCVNNINSVITAENQDFINAPNNYFKGFLGALIGGIAGAVISIVLNMVGFVSSISAIVAIILGTFLYQKFQGKPNKMMIVIVSLTTLVLLAATIPVIYIVAAGIAAKTENIPISALEAFKICMADDEFSRLFYADLFLVILFSAIGTAYEIFILAKKVKRKTNI